MTIRMIGAFFFATIALLVCQLEDAVAKNRSDELKRPIRVLVSGITDQLIQEVRATDTDERIDFSYPSSKLSDFDMLVILVDEYQDAFDVDLLTQMGLGSETLPSNGEHPFIVVLSVEFEGDETPFPVYVIDRRQFYARDTMCHSPFLSDLILKPDWKSTINREADYKVASDCEPIS
ncbi:hypothetical protein [Ruegeria lacuscaerulensis]|uniref:hypothetical protein n=1 Tax=Ruegeria lacuscaerulensis TaxID=55218 RepID=UPI0014816051|nr:hypothetical protein [Ruegeria lacuscaerulensis]